MLTLTVFIGIVSYRVLNHPPAKLVSVAKYDLATVKGQHRFSKAVDNTTPQFSSWTEALTMIIPSAGIVAMLSRKMFRRTVPFRLLQEQLSPPES